MTTETLVSGLERAFVEDRRSLWALCYRMTGSAADADDLVQSTFERALERPPRDTSRPWRPWLFRVAVNLARDQLRRRKRMAYKGPWLPEPIDTDELVGDLAESSPHRSAPTAEPAEPRVEPADTAGRYDLLESVSYAFLVALEALTPTQRAVLLLRDVLEYSARDAALALDLSEPNVRTIHLRARRAMAGYESARVPLGEAASETTRRLAARFVVCLGSRDVAGIEALLTEGVVMLNDGAGEFAAAAVPVIGREKVARFQVGITKGLSQLPDVAWCRLNGLPALVVEVDPQTAKPRQAPRFVILATPSRDGSLGAICMVLAPSKLYATPNIAEARARFDQG